MLVEVARRYIRPVHFTTSSWPASAAAAAAVASAASSGVSTSSAGAGSLRNSKPWLAHPGCSAGAGGAVCSTGSGGGDGQNDSFGEWVAANEKDRRPTQVWGDLALRRGDAERVRLLMSTAPSREVLLAAAADAAVDISGSSECARLLRSALARESWLEKEERLGKDAASAAVRRSVTAQRTSTPPRSRARSPRARS